MSENFCHFHIFKYFLHTDILMFSISNKKMLPILEMTAWNAYCSLAIGLCLNSLLMWIAKKHSGTELREYRGTVYYLSILNIGFLVSQALTQPLILIEGNSVFLLLTGPITKIPSPMLWIIGDIVFFNFYNQSAFAQALQFLNRYLIICRNSSNKFGRGLIQAVLSIVIFTIVLLIIVFSSPKSTASIGDPQFEGNLIISDMDMHENFPLKIVFMLFAILLLTGHLMTVVCFFRIRAFLKANIWNVINGLDRKTLHKIILSMLVQAFIPLYNFAYAGICCVIVITGHYDSDLLKQLILFFCITINWLPILNPIATILTIREYRLQMLDILRLRQSQTTTTIVVLKQILKQQQQQPAPPRST